MKLVYSCCRWKCKRSQFDGFSSVSVLRRSLSEGSLLQEPRSPHFLSDSTIHCLTRPVNFDLSPNSSPASRAPSPHTLRKQLTGEGGSLHQMLMLLNGTKVGTRPGFDHRTTNQCHVTTQRIAAG